MQPDAIFEHLPIAALVADSEGIVRGVNRRMRAYFESVGRGDEVPHLVGQHFRVGAASPELAQQLEAFLGEAMLTDDVITLEWEMPNLLSTAPVFGASMAQRIVEDGVVTGIVWFLQDITDQVLNRHRLSLFEALGSQMRDIVLITDEGGTITDCNPAATDTLGYEREELIGSPLSRLSGDPEGQSERFRKLLRAGGGDQGVMRVIRADGVELKFDTRAIVIDSDGERSMCLVSRDLTEQLQAEQERVQLQRLESLGVLAGGIAHDFNNLLTGIGGRLSLASSYAGAVGELPRLLGEAEEAVGQASRLTDQLLTFAEGGQPVTERVDLEELVRRVATFASAGSATRLRWDIDKDLWAAHVDPGQIGQVVQNLVINARQAMDGHGQIHVVLRNLVIGPYDDASLQAGRYVELRVTDDGPGIPAGILERIFEPYFSTKESSGLGLATTHSIVTNHGGTIKVDSLPTSGTTFTIRLPASDKAEDGQTLAPEDEPAAVNARTATGDALLRVLVMDDNPSLLRLVEEMLVAMGHEAHGVEHGEKALQDFHEALDSGQPFDAAILDLTIEGGIGGMKTGEELLEVVPDLPIFLMSGYSEEGIPEPEAMGFKGFLPKPFNVGDLRRMLETVKS